MQNRELIFERFLASQRLSLAPQYPGLALTDRSISKLRVDAPAARDAWAASCQTSGFGPQCTVRPCSSALLLNHAAGVS